tara:strand:+ start:615 stop:761 length:147 start_codon:yes stop_codon:yes gene_type:complete
VARKLNQLIVKLIMKKYKKEYGTNKLAIQEKALEIILRLKFGGCVINW